MPEILHSNVKNLNKAFERYADDPDFLFEYERLLADYVGRPTPLYHAKRLPGHFGTNIYLKHEDLYHTGAHKIHTIAGTFRRTGDDATDHELAKRLLNDPKENAEHIMLVDLARNDLSRSGGKVHVEFLKQIQFYSHVIHMVSCVVADLPEDADVYRLFGETLPAGTLSGAPKMRAMQLIGEMEPHSRVTYAGCFKIVSNNTEGILEAKDLGLTAGKQEDLFGGNIIAEAAAVFDDVLSETASEPKKNCVIANAAFAIKTLDPEMELKKR